VAIALLLAACSQSAKQSRERAAEAWDSGDYKLAAEEYERYLSQNPAGAQSLEARFQLANIYYFNLHDYEKARAQYSAFINQDPSNADAHTARERLAEVLGELGRSYEAIAEYENLNPQDASERRRIRLRIADLYYAQKNYSQALTEYEKVIEQVPYDDLTEQAYLREASIYHLARAQYQQALPIYQRLARESADPKVHKRSMFAIADCYAGLFKFDDAIKALRSIKDASDQQEITQRISELEQKKHEAAQVPQGIPR
jgi:tetratricopeptide (TPR) repeat protein